MTSEEILNHELHELKKDLIEKHKQLGMIASGNWERELEVNTNQTGSRLRGSIDGEHYTRQLIDGRKAGKFPPISDIMQWVKDKGIAKNAAKESEIKSIAFLIARKIAREGTNYYKRGGTDLVSSVVTPERIQSIIDKISIVNVEAFVETIRSQIKEFAEAA